jgi:hypothetical protein
MSNYPPLSINTGVTGHLQVPSPAGANDSPQSAPIENTAPALPRPPGRRPSFINLLLPSPKEPSLQNPAAGTSGGANTSARRIPTRQRTTGTSIPHQADASSSSSSGLLSVSNMLRKAGNRSATNLRELYGKARPPKAPPELATLKNAIRKGDVAAIHSVIDSYGPELINMRDDNGRTPLMHAAESSRFTSVAVLLSRGADAAATTPDGASALTMARVNWIIESSDMLANNNTAAKKALCTYVLLTELDAEKKLEFEYQPADMQGKFAQEDRFGLEEINSESAVKATFEVAKLAAAHLEDGRNLQAGSEDFVKRLNDAMGWYSGEYPVLKEGFNSFHDLLDFLRMDYDTRSEGDHIKLLSVLWLLPRFVKDDHKKVEHYALYSELVTAAKSNITKSKEERGTPVVSDQFGNSREVRSPIFANETFAPFSRSVDYISVDPSTTSPLVRKYIDDAIPYVSGVSGMANLTGSLLDRMGLELQEETIAKPFCRAMAAFIVGSGMHSYPEVYDSFNLTQKYLKARNAAPANEIRARRV